MVYPTSDTPALYDINLNINEGDFVFLVGASGSGKTTMIRLLTGELKPSSGEIIVNDYDMTKLKRSKLAKVRRTLGVVFQDFRLIEDMTVYDNVAFAMRVVGASSRQIRNRVPYVLDLVGLSGREDRFPRELAGGEQQRVAIARAIVNNPQVLIADEPTGNLDPITAWGIMDLLDQINMRGTTVLMVTHAKEIVDRMDKRIVAIDRGRVIHDSKEAYLGPMGGDEE